MAQKPQYWISRTSLIHFSTQPSPSECPDVLNWRHTEFRSFNEDKKQLKKMIRSMKGKSDSVRDQEKQNVDDW